MEDLIKSKLEILDGKSYDYVSLYSGGLDSVLATKMIKNMKAKILCLQIVLPFHGDPENREPELGRTPGLRSTLLTWPTGNEFIDIIKKPENGYGKNMNPCIDCKIYFFTVARLVMEKVGAKGIITGEVVDERPMSQNKRSMKLIEEKSGLAGKIIRPLTALHCEESEAEKEGLIKRDELLGIRGRSRKPQMELAEKLGITKYETPAGGCLLTDPGFSHRLKESFEKEEHSILDFHLLKFGRHFRLPGGSKLIVGRNEEENGKLKKLFPPSWVKFDGIEVKGPWAGIPGSASLYDLKFAAQIWSRYSQGREEDPLEMRLIYPKNKKQILITHPLKIGLEKPYLIAPKRDIKS